MYLKMQVPEVVKTFPEISEFYAGTLNVQLDQPLVVVRSDHTARALGEVIDIVCVQLEVKEKMHSGWLWVAKTSPLRKTPDVHEFVLPKPKIDIQDGEQCIVHIGRECLVTPSGTVRVI